jgi:hypothetical protein
MALSRSNNEVTSCSGRKLVWRSRTYSHRVGSTATSNVLLSSSVVPAFAGRPSFTRNMSKIWVGMYVYAGFIRCVDILVYVAPSECDLSFLQWETRLLPLDPVTVSHVLKNPDIYEKPSTTRRLIEWLIGRGVHAAEGDAHKRQRRVATPAFSIRNMRALVPLIFNKGEELKDRWMELVQEQAVKNTQKNPMGLQLDVCHWVSRATFDVIGLAGASLPLTRICITPSAYGATSFYVQDSTITSMPSKTKTTNCSKHIKICSSMRFPSLEA